MSCPPGISYTKDESLLLIKKDDSRPKPLAKSTTKIMIIIMDIIPRMVDVA